MSETVNTPPREKKEIFDLPMEKRQVESARLVSEMKGLRVGDRGDEAWPVKLNGDKDQASAFLDLVYTNTEPDKLGIVLSNAGGLRAHKDLIKKLNENGNVVPVRGGGYKRHNSRTYTRYW